MLVAGAELHVGSRAGRDDPNRVHMSRGRAIRAQPHITHLPPGSHALLSPAVLLQTCTITAALLYSLI